jgi:hypothetical protein
VRHNEIPKLCILSYAIFKGKGSQALDLRIFVTVEYQHLVTLLSERVSYRIIGCIVIAFFILRGDEAEFLDVIGTKVLKVFLLAFHSHLYFTTPPPPPLERNWFDTGF